MNASFLLVVFAVLALRQLSSIANHVARSAAMTKRLLAHHGIDREVEAEPSIRVRALARDKRTYVDAIRAYREQTGLGVREAMVVVDRLKRS